jgi:hypothetical protein
LIASTPLLLVSACRLPLRGFYHYSKWNFCSVSHLSVRRLVAKWEIEMSIGTIILIILIIALLGGFSGIGGGPFYGTGYYGGGGLGLVIVVLVVLLLMGRL